MKRRNSNFVAFDLGSSKIAALATNIDNNGQVSIHAQSVHASGGMKSGMITDMELAENSIVNTIYALEKDCDRSIKEVAVSLSGANVKSYYAQQTLKITNQTVTASDVSKLINKALTAFKVENREIIHYFPLEFKVNGNQVVDNPIDLCASEISCQLHIVAAESSMLMNLVKCFAKCHVSISDFILGVYASAMSVVSESEMEIGTTVIEMGANTTSYCIISKGKLIYASSFPIGGNELTLSIARSLSIGIKEAEKMKILYGNASPKLISKDIIIELEDQTRSVTATQISQIVSPIITDIFNKIKQQCDDMSLNNLAAQQVVITGGASALAGIKHCASNVLQKQIRIAKYETITGFTESYNPLSHSTLIGMIKLKIDAIRKKYYKDYLAEDSSILKKIFTWVKNNI
ncbi:MAG: hypothetical protein DGJ47_001173 [Rickettsiaceae bacterium]